MMKIIKDIDKMVLHSRIMRKENKTIGFVPTMGCLHEGHLSLMHNARKQTDVVVVSIFVNPAQFAAGEDYDEYPRDFGRDEELLKTSGVDVLFYPKKEDVYPEGYSTYANVENLTEALCGASRPGHFRGVATVVLKLFNIVKPDIAYFGQKDAQQAFVIKRMIQDLNLDIIMKVLPIVREEDGLAMSSRNAYLNKKERNDAAVLYQSIKKAEELISGGERDAKKITGGMEKVIKEKKSAKIDYVSIVDTDFLKEEDKLKKDKEYLVALAVFIGKTRLIDNTIVRA